MKNNNKLDLIDFSKVVEPGEPPLFYKKIASSILDYLQNNKKSTFQEIVKYVGGSDRRILRLLNQMVLTHMVEFRKPYFFLLDKIFPKVLISNVRCRQCDSMLVDIKSSNEIKKLVNFMQKIVINRPIPTFIYDQRPVTAETTVRRVAYMALRGDIQGKRIAILGDDDLTSIALAKTGMPKEIVVFDIDKRLLNYIKKVAQREKLNIKVSLQDLVKEFQEKYKNHFDTFLTDPPPAPKPMTLFTSLGVKSLIKGNGSTGYVSLYPSHTVKELDFQKNLSIMNVLVTDMIPFFGQYDFIKFTYSDSDLKLLEKYESKEQKISFWEYFMRFETTRDTRPLELKLTALDLLGRATKRVLKDPSKDPVLGSKNAPEFIKKSVREIKKLMEEESVSEMAQ